MKSEIRIVKGKEWRNPGNKGTWSRSVGQTSVKAVDLIVKSFKKQGIVAVVTETEAEYLIAA